MMIIKMMMRGEAREYVDGDSLNNRTRTAGMEMMRRKVRQVARTLEGALVVGNGK